MFNWFRRAYENYREYIKVDLAMYGLLILLIVVYLIYLALR